MNKPLEEAIYLAILEEGALVTSDKAAADIAKIVCNLIEEASE